MKKTITAVALIVIILASLSSCRAGYGCHGNQSWGKMTSRNNRFN